MKGKPDPEIYRAALERLQVPAAEAVILEDSPSGARAAIASGATVVVVVNQLTRRNVERAGLEGEVEAVVASDPRLLPHVQGLFR